MRIAFVASEAFPFAKTGGLGDVAGALPKALADLGEECLLFLPYYPGIKAAPTKKTLTVKIGPASEKVALYSAREPIATFFIGHERFFHRPGLYGDAAGDYPDNLERFTLFCRAVLATLVRLDLKFDIIHLHDWQAALVAPYLRAGRGPPADRPKTVFTIHNLGYQGLFPKTKFGLLGLPPDYFSLHGIEFYDQVSLLKAGLVYSDLLTTVSPTYAREIQTADFGFGLDGILKERSGQLRGILNGIDREIWNPAKDRMIYYNYRDHHDKSINTIQLKKEAGLESGDQPLIGVVSRLAAQKGIDLLCDVFDTIMAWGYQLIILGTGEEEYHRRLKEQAAKYPRQVSLNLKFDEQLAHRIYAGADIFLMPSRYEPCGLGQMIALTYATVPVVRRTGGLADSVFEFNTAARTGNGFLFEDYKSGALLAALKRAREVFDNPDLWSALVVNTRQYDFSWQRAAGEYQALYRQLAPGSAAS